MANASVEEKKVCKLVSSREDKFKVLERHTIGKSFFTIALMMIACRPHRYIAAFLTINFLAIHFLSGQRSS